MDIDQLRKLCLSFPGATEQIQWGDDLLFKVGGKMFAVAPLEPAKIWISLKASPENFAELTERPGVLPAPYLARAKWIALESQDALPAAQITQLLRESYELVLAKLPRKMRESIARGDRAVPGAKGKRGRRTITKKMK
ncbi:MAG TPA: MmcQ/YjbR family DNA-binding protein [Candidatus Acidoferrales bacterium]|jgi:predicted DNA-binding protein (MmcQ/YjbR family)|nr:MmcQ/YjbR family DNA-binding protein [Candidatus Acidoferrales bacterium]